MGMIEGFLGKNPDNPLLDLTPETQACMIFQDHPEIISLEDN